MGTPTGKYIFNLMSWGIAAEVLNCQFSRMKLTNDPENYKDDPVDEEVYLIMPQQNRKF